MSEKFLINNYGEKIDTTQFYCIIDAMQVSVYWKNAQGVYLGCNQYMAELSGKRDRAAIIGKTDYDMPWKDAADDIREIELRVMQDRHFHRVEESSKFTSSSKTRFFLSTKSPLINDADEVIGIIGTSVEITAEKEAEQLEMKAELQKAQLQEQEKFKRIVDQAVHDIRSPLSALLMMAQCCESYLPEKVLPTIRNSISSISNIATDLLNRYGREGLRHSQVAQPVLVFLAVEDVLLDKRYQYRNLITFQLQRAPGFAFIHIEPLGFKRMISNLIDNAVEAMNGELGEVRLTLRASDREVQIVVEDHGKGMPPEVVDQILRGMPMSVGKKEGHGVGMIQVHEALERTQGKLDIESTLGQGTRVILTFPKSTWANWMVDEVRLHPGDTVVIVDDDPLMGQAWETRLQPYCKKILLKPFAQGSEAISFLKDFPDPDKLLVLVDYELVKQKEDGFSVIEDSGIRLAILVTSYYNDEIVRRRAEALGIKILPKPLIHEIPMIFDECACKGSS